MTIKRMTPQQRDAYALVRRGSAAITPDNARPLHALKRRGLVRFTVNPLGVRVAVPRRNAATARVERSVNWITAGLVLGALLVWIA